MSTKRIYAVITGKDNFLANIVDEEHALSFAWPDATKEGDTTTPPLYINGFKKDVIVLENVTIMIANGKQIGILPFKDLAFGSPYVTLPVAQITEIYLVDEKLSTQVRAAISGLATV